MFEGLILTVASFFSANSPVFFEQEVTLPQGEFEISTEELWNAVTFFTTDGTPVPHLEYELDGKMYEWDAAEEGDHHREDLLSLAYFDTPRRSIKIHSEGTKDVIAHFYNTHISHEDETALLSETGQEFMEDDLAETFRVTGEAVPKFFTREQWGADESLRVQTFSQRFFNPKKWRWFSRETQDLAPEFKPKFAFSKNLDGEELFWPVYHNQVMKTMVVHHTAEIVKNRSKTKTAKEIMRAMYYYHTVTKGWGDIGYNYVIDQAGNIYEGKTGGPLSVGAHTAYHNVGTLGVALMGNFQYEEPTDVQMSVLALLLADHAERFGIDPEGSEKFLGITSDNITGHRYLARQGHGTACPGLNMVKRLPELRKKTAQFLKLLKKLEKEGKRTTRDFLGKSELAPKVLKDKTFKRREKPAPIEFGITQKVVLSRGQEKTVEFVAQNNTQEAWEPLTEIELVDPPDGMIVSKFRSTEKIMPHKKGAFRGKIAVKDTPNGLYQLKFWPSFLEKKYSNLQLKKSQLELSVQVSGGRELLFTRGLQSNTIVRPAGYSPLAQLKKPTGVSRFKAEPKTKVKLADLDSSYLEITNTEDTEIWERSNQLFIVPPSTPIKISAQAVSVGRGKLKIEAGDLKTDLTQIRLVNPSEGILTLHNYQSERYGGGRIKYNRFRGDLEVHPLAGKKLLAVNELPLEQYLWGLAEQPKQEPEQKKHAIHVLARSYAYVYGGARRKFGTHLYDLENDPRTSQLYLGYDWETYHNEQKALIAKTRGEVLTYKNNVVIGPYFTQSSGWSSDKWSKQYPWTRAQELPFDKGLKPAGHGVGLSGNSARELAKLGKSYREIIDYFFDDVEVKKKY